MKHGEKHQSLIPSVKHKGGTIIVWVALLLHDLDSFPSLTEKWIPMFIRIFWWITWFVFQSQLNRCWVIHQDNDIGVIQQQNSFNRRKYSSWSSPESWPQPDWEGLAWPQESNSHQTSQEYCRAGTVLFRGVVQHSSWPLSRIDLQLQEALVSLALSVQRLAETAEQLFAT